MATVDESVISSVVADLNNCGSHCAGIIVLDSSENPQKVTLVVTPGGFASFPKGKKERKVDTDLTATALRELYEETGLEKKMLIWPPLETVFEYKTPGERPTVAYFITALRDSGLATDALPELRAVDAEEIASVTWADVASLDSFKWHAKRRPVIHHVKTFQKRKNSK